MYIGDFRPIRQSWDKVSMYLFNIYEENNKLKAVHVNVYLEV